MRLLATKALPELEKLTKNGRYEEALELLDRVGTERGLSLPELVSKGMMIQVASKSHDPAEAKQAFETALAADGSYLPALVELAFFNHMIEDDSSKALPLFEKAIELSLGYLRESVLGKMKCLEELDSLDSAMSFLHQLKQECLDVKSLEEEISG